MHKAHRVKAAVGGTTLALETGCIAQLADGAVVARQGDSMVVAAVVASQDVSEDHGFFPLTVEYREKMASAGRIPGGYLRRESRSTEGETLISRLIDRSIRPLFPAGFRGDTQVSITLMSHEPDIDPGVLGINAAGAALLCSDLPWDGPVAAVRMVRIGERLVAAPTAAEQAKASLNLVASFTRQGLVMAEGRIDQEPEERLLEALDCAWEAADPLLAALEQLGEVAAVETRSYRLGSAHEDLVRAMEEHLIPHFAAITGVSSKRQRQSLQQSAQAQALVALEGLASPEVLAQAAQTAMRRQLRAEALRGRRLDGRRLNEIRTISAETGWLPRAHGSAVFTRGETQAVVTCTLGTSREGQEIETLDGSVRRRFLVHYNFPPYSVGEVRPSRGPGRRELGHGSLVRAALEPAVPEASAFPFTIRVESEITQSNGSSSMASVCGGSLALMDAGVPIAAGVAGVAMGLVMEGESHAVLTDITGDEDHAGDMDFKVAGTRTGITAVQLDNKLGAVPTAILAGALRQARQARLQILDAMGAVCDRPRTRLGGHVPRVEVIRIRPNRIRELIGPSGKTIQELQAATGTRIEAGRDGTVRVWAEGEADLAQALSRIRDLTGLAEVDRVYQGTVATVTEYGCYVRLFGSVEGFLPAGYENASPSAGARVTVRVVGVDRRGRIELVPPGDTGESGQGG
ncbi:polyribonucleotide nucleotidyltransferase [Candidatus Fermentibacteria bacterium]|nr:polyribonucleotide nucleotidyltransferase [Candidatus Fermentibacteria bacterium]